ncbi:hypothetical protein LEP1GSC202_0582 [Leptospira yanagawae serovar Saopaulo str. Sao Paulo = ATCC 700523]|uniref:Uncharacterized protein n=1 Tax=Leptospira yanagawae serovar Saopaulo str. Sao Paulo = ATCC 700523 TaxID=1249483 RepID=A0A5E8HH32_9LEPT|nr:hypothetical protein LEP1GSC202_0582 [Leptospira yanagawae serovar Saopaulo str. Sao Paulo = ATCC 700523]
MLIQIISFHTSNLRNQISSTHLGSSLSGNRSKCPAYLRVSIHELILMIPSLNYIIVSA